MALEALTARANTGTGTDQLAVVETGSGKAGAVALVNHAGDLIDSGHPLPVDVTFPTTQDVAVIGTVPVSVTFPTTQAVSAASLPLPTGAATETTLAALNSKLPSPGQAAMAASQPVVIASDQSAVPVVETPLVLTGAAAQTATVNNILGSVSGAAGTNVEAFRTATVQVVSTGTGGTFIFEQSNDDVNWIALPVFNAALATAVPIVAAITATASAIIYTIPLRARFIRLRIATTITGGSIRAFSRISSEAWTPAVFSVAQGTAANLQTTVAGSVTATLAAATVRAGFVAGAGIWYDDTATSLAANATFTGTSRDATVTASATAFANAATYAQEVRVSAESDVAGTLWLEVSRDNAAWRRAKAVATSAVTGGGQYAEIVHRPSWRYWRVGYTNGATVQARLSVGSLAMAV
jgi:hypothetical protein